MDTHESEDFLCRLDALDILNDEVEFDDVNKFIDKITRNFMGHTIVLDKLISLTEKHIGKEFHKELLNEVNNKIIREFEELFSKIAKKIKSQGLIQHFSEVPEWIDMFINEKLFTNTIVKLIKEHQDNIFLHFSINHVCNIRPEDIVETATFENLPKGCLKYNTFRNIVRYVYDKYNENLVINEHFRDLLFRMFYCDNFSLLYCMHTLSKIENKEIIFTMQDILDEKRVKYFCKFFCNHLEANTDIISKNNFDSLVSDFSNLTKETLDQINSYIDNNYDILESRTYIKSFLIHSLCRYLFLELRKNQNYYSLNSDITINMVLETICKLFKGDPEQITELCSAYTTKNHIKIIKSLKVNYIAQSMLLYLRNRDMNDIKSNFGSNIQESDLIIEIAHHNPHLIPNIFELLDYKTTKKFYELKAGTETVKKVLSFLFLSGYATQTMIFVSKAKITDKALYNIIFRTLSQLINSKRFSKNLIQAFFTLLLSEGFKTNKRAEKFEIEKARNIYQKIKEEYPEIISEFSRDVNKIEEALY